MSDELETRLENWGHLQRWKRRAGEAASFEGRYRSPQRNHHEIPSTVALPEYSLGLERAQDAELIEDCVGALPFRYHVMLRLWYVNQAPSWSLVRGARKIGFVRPSMREVEACLAMAKALLVKELLVPAAARAARKKDWVEKNVQRAIDFALTAD